MGLPEEELLEELEDELDDELLDDELMEDELLDEELELLDELLDEEEELEGAPPPDDADCPPHPVARIVAMTRGKNFVVI